MPAPGNNVKSMIWIRLTERQNEIALWAIEGQRDHLSYLKEHGEINQIPPLAGTDGTYLMLPPYRDLIDDLVYRLEDQFQDICDDEGTPAARADARVAMRIVDKIRAVTSSI